MRGGYISMSSRESERELLKSTISNGTQRSRDSCVSPFPFFFLYYYLSVGIYCACVCVCICLCKAIRQSHVRVFFSHIDVVLRAAFMTAHCFSFFFFFYEHSVCDFEPCAEAATCAAAP